MSGTSHTDRARTAPAALLLVWIYFSCLSFLPASTIHTFYNCTVGVEHSHHRCTCTVTIKAYSGLFAVSGAGVHAEEMHLETGPSCVALTGADNGPTWHTVSSSFINFTIITVN